MLSQGNVDTYATAAQDSKSLSSVDFNKNVIKIVFFIFFLNILMYQDFDLWQEQQQAGGPKKSACNSSRQSGVSKS